jgi:hypothetical protein
MQHRDSGGDVAQGDREIELVVGLLHRGEPVVQEEPVIVDEADLLWRVLRARVEQHRAQADLQGLLGHARGAVGRARRGERRDRQHERAAGRRKRGDRARVGHRRAGY